MTINPDDVLANNLIGLYWLNKNDADKAVAQFEAALKKEPSNPAAYYYMAIVAQRQGDNQTALNHLRKAIELAPTFKPAYEFSVMIYEAMGNSAMAEQFRGYLKQLK